jgi:hypothetical protein
VSGRRSEPPALPPATRTVDGRLQIGTDPWAECGWCGAVFDTVEFYCCPVCLAFAQALNDVVTFH